MEIDWARMAEPQEDGYDNAITLLEAAKRYNFSKSPREEPTIFEGQVNLRTEELRLIDHLVAAPLNARSVLEAEALLKTWPVVYRQVQALVDTLYPLRDLNFSEYDEQSVGCTCGGGKTWGSIYSTVTDPVGFVEGIVHEMGHWKLHALGVHLEDWDNLLLNKPDDLYPSPIRKDKLRPVGAVLQAQWSYVYVTGIDAHILRDSLEKSARDYPDLEYPPKRAYRHLMINVKRIEEGRETLLSCAKGDENGVPFLEAFYDWTDRVIADGRELLRDN